MKLSFGSIQRKGSALYYVSRLHGRQSWISLKTGDPRLARLRARLLVPTSDSSQSAWLRQLVRLGEKARHRLQGIEHRSTLGWASLWDDFLACTRTPIPAASHASYRRWLTLLAQAARTQNPDDLTALDARAIADVLRKTYLSVNRMIRFYRRVWRALGLNVDIWREEVRIHGDPANGKVHTFYRRLTTDEVRRVHGILLETASSMPDPTAYADMVVLGYYTGLRLSDVAELETGEITPDGAFLRLQPNKVRHSKKRLLLIPLVDTAQTIVQRRRQIPVDGDFLFPAATRKRPSKPITAAFRTAGIVNKGPARASFHSLRATFISLMDEAGIPPHVTDAITGHAGGGMHARYTQPSAETLRKAVTRAIPPLWVRSPLKRCICASTQSARGVDALSSRHPATPSLELPLEDAAPVLPAPDAGPDGMSGPGLTPGVSRNGLRKWKRANKLTTK